MTNEKIMQLDDTGTVFAIVSDMRINGHRRGIPLLRIVVQGKDRADLVVLCPKEIAALGEYIAGLSTFKTGTMAVIDTESGQRFATYTSASLDGQRVGPPMLRIITQETGSRASVVALSGLEAEKLGFFISQMQKAS